VPFKQRNAWSSGVLERGEFFLFAICDHHFCVFREKRKAYSPSQSSGSTGDQSDIAGKAHVHFVPPGIPPLYQKHRWEDSRNRQNKTSENKNGGRSPHPNSSS
jgi:hypothetical protein